MHIFKGNWITDGEFFELKPRNVFHKQLEKVDLPCDEHRDRHILFRKSFELSSDFTDAKIYISADDYYKLYINGEFVAQGPAPCYHFQYNYNVVDVAKHLKKGKNVIAVHTLYQGLINRVWQSGDNRHGLILDLVIDGEAVVYSDETFKTKPHSGYRETGIYGYDTQFVEEYNSCCEEVGFQNCDYDDSGWEYAKKHKFSDHTLTEQKSAMLCFERIDPVKTVKKGNKLFVDFGSNYVGYLVAKAQGKAGDVITVRCGQELENDGSLRFELRANCKYEEDWILAEGESTLDWFDYKSFRYAELQIPETAEITDVYFNVRHYPFELKAQLKPEYSDNEALKKIWDLCVHTQKYGVQEVIQDCMEREKGFYVGDGCYTALTNMVLTGDDSIVRKLIDDAFSSDFITDGLVTCLDCSFMQEIAEYPLMLVFLVLWHYRVTQDKDYLATNYSKVVKLLETYRRDYEENGLLCDLDKWCVVEWPQNFRHGYDVDITEGQVCEQSHISINAYYIEAVKIANKMAEILNRENYRDEKPLITAFIDTFYDKEARLFKDGAETQHKSLVGNVFPFAFSLCPDEKCFKNIIAWLRQEGIHSLSMFCTFPVLMGLVNYGREDIIKEMLLDKEAWLRIIREDGTTTFEGWGKDTKWNTSLFHLTMSYAALFMADIDLRKILE